MNAGAIAQGAISAAVASGIFAAGFRLYTEKRITHAFAKKLAEYQATLDERSGMRSVIGTKRIEAYESLIAIVRRVHKRCRECLEADTTSLPGLVDALLAACNQLEEELYTHSLSLQLDGVYDGVHTVKTQAKSLGKRLRNAATADDPERARAIVREARADAPEVLAEALGVVHNLENTVRASAQ